MNLSPVLDVGWAPLTYMLGTGAVVLSFPLIVLGEAFVLKGLLLKGRSFWRSVRDSFLVNLASGLLGLVWQLTLGLVQMTVVTELLAGGGSTDYYTASNSAVAALLFSIVLVYWLLSVIVEGILLRLLERPQPTRRVWLTSMVANGASYVVLAIFMGLYAYAG